MTNSQLEQFERRLLAERRRIQSNLSHVGAGQLDSTYDRGRPGDDLDVSRAGVSVADDAAVVVHASRGLAEIDGALAMLHDDPTHYGVCAACAAAIPLGRLRLVPGARYCQLHMPE